MGFVWFLKTKTQFSQNEPSGKTHDFGNLPINLNQGSQFEAPFQSLAGVCCISGSLA